MTRCCTRAAAARRRAYAERLGGLRRGRRTSRGVWPPERLRRAHRRFAKWAAHHPEKFLARAQILEGEVARLQGKCALSARLHTAAAETAATFDQPHLVALASQLAAASHRKAANMADADRLRQRSVEAWERWGATAYARHLSARHPDPAARALPDGLSPAAPSPAVGASADRRR